MVNANRIGVIAFLQLFLLASFVSAFGVATPYWDEHPLRLYPGGNATVNLNLQNGFGEKVYSFNATLIDDGKGIARLLEKGKIYEVPIGGEIYIPVEIIIPKEVAYGDTRQIKVSFLEVSGEDEGMVTVSGKLSASFPVEIIEKPKVKEPKDITPIEQAPSRTILYFSFLALMIIFGILIYFILRARQERKKKHSHRK